MEARVYKIKDRAAAEKILEDDRVKRYGYIQRDGAFLGVGDGTYIYIEAKGDIFELIEGSGAFERPENEEEIKKKIKEEQDSATGAVNFLGM